MPEGDTVYALARRLDKVLRGATLTKTDFRVPRWALADLSGGRVSAVRSVGKHLFIDVDMPDGAKRSIHSHLKMEGMWHVHREGTRWRRPGHTARVILRAGDTEAVGFDLGMLDVLDDPSTAVAHLGPDLLGDDWDPELAIANLAAHPDTPIGVTLLDQRLMAGVGNVYRSEVCFLQRVSPMAPTGDVDLPAIVETSRNLLWANRVRTTRCTTGVLVRGKELWVYGRGRRPCRRCGEPIDRSHIDDRVVYTCPRCQRLG